MRLGAATAADRVTDVPATLPDATTPDVWATWPAVLALCGPLFQVPRRTLPCPRATRQQDGSIGITEAHKENDAQ